MSGAFNPSWTTSQPNNLFLRAKASAREGKRLLSTARYPQALDHYQQAVKDFQELGKNDHLARALNHLGVCRMMAGELDRAIQDLQQARKLARELEDSELQAAAAGNLGLVYTKKSDYTKAVRAHKQVMESAEQQGDLELKLQAQVHLADCYLQEGRVRQAEGFALVARDLARSLNNQRQLITIHGLLGMISARRRDHRTAIEHHQQAHNLAECLGDRENQAQALANQALSHEALTELPRALEYMARAEQLFKELDSPLLEKTLQDRQRMRKAHTLSRSDHGE